MNVQLEFMYNDCLLQEPLEYIAEQWFSTANKQMRFI